MTAIPLTLEPGANSLLDSPIFLCGHRKSGTTMLLCLLDSHPELLTYPADSAFFYSVFPRCFQDGGGDPVAAIQQHTIRENLTSEMEKAQTPGLFDIEVIAGRFAELAEATDRSPQALLKALMQAYGECCGQDSRRWKRWVEKTTSTEVYAVEIADWFPKAKFVHLLRDPRDNFASLKSGWVKRYREQEPDMRSLLQTLIDRGGIGLRAANTNLEVLGADRYLIVRYEDLTRDPQAMLAHIAAFIGVEFDPKLLVPTVNGVPWVGNNFDGLVFDQPTTINVGRWSERISRQEAAVIEGFLAEAMEGHGYELVTSSAERARAVSEHYKWFNFVGRGAR